MKKLILSVILAVGITAAQGSGAKEPLKYPTYDSSADNDYGGYSRESQRLYPRYDPSADNDYRYQRRAMRPLPRRYPYYNPSADNAYPYRRQAPSAAQIDNRRRMPKFYPMYDAHRDTPTAPGGYIAIPRRDYYGEGSRRSDAYDRFFDE